MTPRVEPYNEQTEEGFVDYGGDITSAFCGDYTTNMLARLTGTAFCRFSSIMVSRPKR